MVQTRTDLPPPRFIIQPDWDEALKDGDNEIWISVHQNGETLHSKLHKCRKTSQNSAQTLTCSDPTIEAQSDLSKTITLRRQVANLHSTFYAPVKIFGKVHQKSIQCLDVNLNGLGISASTDGKLLVWDNRDGDGRRSLTGHLADVYCCRFFPSGLVAVSAGADMMIKIWAVDNGACAQTLTGHSQAITDVGFIDKGRNIISCSKDGSLKLWDCGSAKCLTTIDCQCGQINKLALTVSNERSSTSTSTEKDALEAGTADKIVAVACQNGTVRLYALDSRENISNTTLNSDVNVVSFVSQHQIVCGTQSGLLTGLDIRKTSEPLFVSNDDRGSVHDLLPFYNGYFCSFADGTCCYKSLNVNETNTGSAAELTGPDCDVVYNIAKDEQYLYTCCRDAKIRKYIHPNL